MTLSIRIRATKCRVCGGRTEEIDGACLREARIEAGISLREMARRLKLSAPYLSDIERNHRAAPDRVVQRYEHLAAPAHDGRGK